LAEFYWLCDKTSKHPAYYFTYDTQKRTLVPFCEETAEAFPELMPAGDTLVNVEVLNANEEREHLVESEYMGTELKLPEKWFREVMNY
jgi:hypothetical protein